MNASYASGKKYYTPSAEDATLILATMVRYITAHEKEWEAQQPYIAIVLPSMATRLDSGWRSYA